MKHIDLFSGIGGFALAARWMGWQTLCFVERDAFCRAVLRKNFGEDIKIYDDVREFTAKPFRDADIITGGFPCQPFSAAGRRQGARDDRYLWPEVVRIVEESNAPWGVFENVLGLTTMVFDVADSNVESLICDRQPDRDYFEKVLTRKEIMQLGVCCKDLEEIGYEVQPFIVPACSVGAPHRRYRIWIVAYSESKRLDKERRSERRDKAERIARPNSRLGTNTEREGLALSEASGLNIGVQHAERNDSQLDTVDDKKSGGIGRRGRRNGDPRRRGRKIQTARSDPALYENASELSGDEHRNQWREPWIEAATRLCTLDDGLSGRLLRSAGWKSDADWRVNALMAAGNAVVPQVVYELFLALGKADAM